MARCLRVFAAIFVTWAASSASASAELVFLTSGRNLSVKSHRLEGDSIVLQLRAGGEIVCDRALVARIEPDEVAYPEPVDPVDMHARAQPATAEVVGGEARPYAETIDALAAKHGVPANLVRAVVQVESAYQPKARSSKGAMGLMQLMPATARQYSVQNPYDPQSNLDAGIKHLRSLLDRFEVSLALAAYNAGEAAVRRFGGIPPYPETRSYVARILQLVRARQQTG